MAVFHEVYFNEGEGLAHEDLNAVQGVLRAAFLDTLGQLARLQLYGTEETYRLPSADHLFCIGAGGAPTAITSAFYGGSGLTMNNRAGIIFQMIGDASDTDPAIPSGDTPEFLSYYVEENEWQTTFAANSSGQDRIDIVCIKLDYATGDNEDRDVEDATTRVVTTQSIPKRKRVTCDLQVVQGTPAATPVEEVPPAGYVKLAGAYIANGATDLAAGNLRDYRIPLGIKFIDVCAAEMNNLGASFDTILKKGTWAGGNSIGGLSPNALSGLDAFFIARATGLSGNQRIIAVQLHSVGVTAANWSAKLQELTYGGATDLETVTSGLFPGTGAILTQEALLATPRWGNAQPAGHAVDLDQAPLVTPFHLGLKLRTTVAPAADVINFVRFVVAGTLTA